MSACSTYTDAMLIEALESGSDAAYTEIFNRYGRLLTAHAFRMLGNREDAKDMVHDVFLAIWQNREKLRFSTSLSAYLFTAVRNRVLNHLAHQKVVTEYAVSFAGFMQEGQCFTDNRLLEKEMAAMIAREVEALPPKMREVFLLSRMDECSYKEIADRLNITEHTARQQVYNALKILRQKINSLINLLLLL